MRQHSVDPSRAGWVGVARYWDTVPGGLHSANLSGGQDKERRPPQGGGWEKPRAGRRCPSPSPRTWSLLAASGTAVPRLLHSHLALQREGGPPSPLRRKAQRPTLPA